MNANETLSNLFDGWGTSDAYGSETVYLHVSEIEKLARENRSGTRDSQNKKGWPSNDEARAGFEPLLKTGDTIDDFCNSWKHLQRWRDNKMMGGAGHQSNLAEQRKLWIMMLAIMDAHDSN